MKKKLTSLFAIPLCLAVCAGCSATNASAAGHKEEYKLNPTDVLNYTLAENRPLYAFFDVDGGYNHYNYLWQGYAVTPSGERSHPDEERRYAYLSEYGEAGDYVLVYMNERVIRELLPWLEAKEGAPTAEKDGLSANYAVDYHFTLASEEHIIDGKYLFAYQALHDLLSEEKQISAKSENFICTVSQTCTDIPYYAGEENDYRLVFCAQSKPVTIKENLSTKTTVDKTITCYNAVTLEHDKDRTARELGEDEGKDAAWRRANAKGFRFVGEQIETYTVGYESRNAIFAPYFGVGKGESFSPTVLNVQQIGTEKFVELPRYNSAGDDLLDPSKEYTSTHNVFGIYKQQFSEAFVRMADGSDTMGLFDYEEVRNIIH